MRVVLALLVFTLTSVAGAAADDTIWGALVLASNGKEPQRASPELKPFREQLVNIFGYKHYELIGQQAKRIDQSRERWLIPSQELYLHVNPRKKSEDAYLLNLQLYHGRKMLVQTEAKLGPKSPLFIRGPFYGNGQLIIILLVK